MKKIHIVLVLILFCVLAIPIQAQYDRVYENGSVWAVSYIETLPGHFDDYLENLSNVWKKNLETLIEDEVVLSYKILSIPDPRDNEPNLILLVEYKNWSVFDMPNEYWDNVTMKTMGSLNEAKQANIKREELRKLRGGLTGVELIFK